MRFWVVMVTNGKDEFSAVWVLYLARGVNACDEACEIRSGGLLVQVSKYILKAIFASFQALPH